MREQRLVFGEVAELYDRARASYPDALVDDVIEFAGLSARTARALEVGAGTGKATASFAARGLAVTALEPSIDMAAVAARNCPDVTIEVSSFEGWSGDPGTFDLVYSAQAWHWVDPGVRWRKAAELLKPGGCIALFWHRSLWRDGGLREELDQLYRRLVPDLRKANPGFPGFDPGDWEDAMTEELSGTGLFQAAVDRSYSWDRTFDATGYTELLLTQSDHRLLDESLRETLVASIRDLIDEHGGTVTVPHATWLLMSRRQTP